MRRLLNWTRAVSALRLRTLASTLWPPDRDARVAVVAAAVSILGALGTGLGAVGTLWSARFAGGQAEAARVSARAAQDAVPYARASAEAAVETLRRSDEDLRILVDLDRDAPVAVQRSFPDHGGIFSIRMLADAVVINTGGSPAVVTDSLVETHSVGLVIANRLAVFEATEGTKWAKFTVVRPGEPQRLRLQASLMVNFKAHPVAAAALSALLNRYCPGDQRSTCEFPSFTTLESEIRSHAGEENVQEIERHLYGSVAQLGFSFAASHWSEEGEVSFTRIILKIGTANRRNYRSSPGLLLTGGPDTVYRVPEPPRTQATSSRR